MLLTALTTTFSAKGRQIINRLSDLSPKLALWKNYISKSLMQTKKEKSLYLEEIAKFQKKLIQPSVVLPCTIQSLNCQLVFTIFDYFS